MEEGDSLAGLADVDDPELEWKFCVGAVPAMLVLGLVFHSVMPFLQRTFLAMPVHELGHAVTAWLCGYFAIPTLWKTLVPDERGFVDAAPHRAALPSAYQRYLATAMVASTLVGFVPAVVVVTVLGGGLLWLWGAIALWIAVRGVTGGWRFAGTGWQVTGATR